MREQAEKDDSLQRGNKNDACLDIVLQVWVEYGWCTRGSVSKLKSAASKKSDPFVLLKGTTSETLKRKGNLEPWRRLYSSNSSNKSKQTCPGSRYPLKVSILRVKGPQEDLEPLPTQKSLTLYKLFHHQDHQCLQTWTSWAHSWPEGGKAQSCSLSPSFLKTPICVLYPWLLCFRHCTTRASSTKQWNS